MHIGNLKALHQIHSGFITYYSICAAYLHPYYSTSTSISPMYPEYSSTLRYVPSNQEHGGCLLHESPC
jgi:hypothetical protein